MVDVLGSEKMAYLLGSLACSSSKPLALVISGGKDSILEESGESSTNGDGSTCPKGERACADVWKAWDPTDWRI